MADIDTGTLRGDLLALARVLLDTFTGPYGAVQLHMLMDTRLYQEVRDATAEYRAVLVTAGRGIARRAGVNPTLITDLVVGGIQNHVLSTPPELQPKMQEQMYEYAERLVDAAVRGTT